MKRVIAAILTLMLVATAAVTAAVAEDETVSGGDGYYYVYTENGKGLNVRDMPGGTVVGSLKYGTRVYCYYKDGGTGWALIDYTYDKPGYGRGTYACYIASRFLRKTKPAPKNSSSGSSTSGSSIGADTPTDPLPESAFTGGSTAVSEPAAAEPVNAAAGSVDELNREFLSAQKVTPYVVYVRPSRVSGWVNMRWAPSLDSSILATYKANDQLTVIYETANWLQVEDKNTGNVGFINRQYVSQ